LSEVLNIVRVTYWDRSMISSKLLYMIVSGNLLDSVRGIKCYL